MVTALPPVGDTHELGGAEGGQAENYHTKAQSLKEEWNREKMDKGEIKVLVSFFGAFTKPKQKSTKM